MSLEAIEKYSRIPEDIQKQLIGPRWIPLTAELHQFLENESWDEVRKELQSIELENQQFLLTREECIRIVDQLSILYWQNKQHKAPINIELKGEEHELLSMKDAALNMLYRYEKDPLEPKNYPFTAEIEWLDSNNVIDQTTPYYIAKSSFNVIRFMGADIFNSNDRKHPQLPIEQEVILNLNELINK